MLRLLPSLFALATALAQAPETAAAKPPSPPGSIEQITQRELLAHATFLASDELGGRLTGSPGQEAAAKYIAAHFAQLGLEPLGDEVDGKRTWFQHYGIARTFVRDTARLELGSVSLSDGFAILGGRPLDASIAGPLLFCGLGRTGGERADVAGDTALDGKIAVVVVRPLKSRTKVLDAERKFMTASGTLTRLGRITSVLGKRGASAVVFLQLTDDDGLSDVLAYFAVSPGKDRVLATFRGADPSMSAVGDVLGGGGDGPPTLVLSKHSSAKVLAELGVDAAAAAALAAGTGERPDAKADVTAKLTIAVGHDAHATASNVVAVLRGSDPLLAAEAIVYSAHMDHVGTRIDGDVFNGADDNASGSAGLMAIATAFAKAQPRPARSVIFLSVSGEELGLWGSAYFTDHPPWDLASIVANVNTDMIGRNGPESKATEVTVTPSNDHRMFSTIVQDAARFAAVLDLSFMSGDKYYVRSDHYNFARKDIPVVFFCNGEHEDYHQVSDHADKLDGAKMERISRLAFWTGWHVANAKERPRVLGVRDAWY